jgi:hypothetical protein
MQQRVTFGCQLSMLARALLPWRIALTWHRSSMQPRRKGVVY